MDNNDSVSKQQPGLAEDLARALPKLTSEQTARVSPKLKRESFEGGATIIEQGDAPDRFYIVIDGQAEVIHEGLSGRTGRVSICGPGEFFGETGLLQNRPRNATVRVPDDGFLEVLVLERDDFLNMIRESRATEMHVAREMLQRLIDLANAQ